MAPRCSSRPRASTRGSLDRHGHLRGRAHVGTDDVSGLGLSPTGSACTSRSTTRRGLDATTGSELAGVGREPRPDRTRAWPRPRSRSGRAVAGRGAPVGQDRWMRRRSCRPSPPCSRSRSRRSLPARSATSPWDGFRSIVFRDHDEVEIGSRNERPMTRYFPEVVEAIRANLPERAVVDGEIVVPDPELGRLEFETLQQRIHPADSRVRMLAEATPAHLVAFDLLALGDDDLTSRPFAERRTAPRGRAHGREVADPRHAGHDRRGVARGGSTSSRGGLDGVVAKPLEGTYQQDKRGDVQDQARAHRRLRRGRVPATRAAPMPSGRSCSGCTTTRACSPTSG